MLTELITLRAEILFPATPALNSRQLASIRSKWVKAYNHINRKEKPNMHVIRYPQWLIHHITDYFGLPEALAQVQIGTAAEEIAEAGGHTNLVEIARELGLNINSQEGDRFLTWANAIKQFGV